MPAANMPNTYSNSRNENYDNEEPRNAYNRDGGGVGGDHASSQEGCVLTVHNLCWTVTDDDLVAEFPRAIKASVKMNDQSRSRGYDRFFCFAY